MYFAEKTALYAARRRMNLKETSKLKRRFVLALLALLIMLIAVTGATLAWYIFTVNAHTTRLHMAAGSSISLQISDTGAENSFSSTVSMQEFQGRLTPVSTDKIANGFQRAEGFTTKSGSNVLFASVFGESPYEDEDYYKTSLFFKTTAARELDVYLADVSFTDSDEGNPISSAIRLGFVVPGTKEEYIFAIGDKKNPKRQYNTYNGSEGENNVLNSTLTDGSVVSFIPLDSDNYCNYDSSTGETSLKPESKPLFKVIGNNNELGEAVELEVYIWLEGCDEDCTVNLCNTTLSELALIFAGFDPEEQNNEPTS